MRARNPEYPPERAIPGIIARLTAKGGNEMTRAANASINHVNHLDGWGAANPSIDDSQAKRLAVMLRRGACVGTGKLLTQVRRLTREIAAELLQGEG
jgi:hypothetical protein